MAVYRVGSVPPLDGSDAMDKPGSFLSSPRRTRSLWDSRNGAQASNGPQRAAWPFKVRAQAEPRTDRPDPGTTRPPFMS